MKIDESNSYRQKNVINNKIVITNTTEKAYLAGGKNIAELKSSR